MGRDIEIPPRHGNDTFIPGADNRSDYRGDINGISSQICLDFLNQTRRQNLLVSGARRGTRFFFKRGVLMSGKPVKLFVNHMKAFNLFFNLLPCIQITRSPLLASLDDTAGDLFYLKKFGCQGIQRGKGFPVFRLFNSGRNTIKQTRPPEQDKFINRYFV